MAAAIGSRERRVRRMIFVADGTIVRRWRCEGLEVEL